MDQQEIGSIPGVNLQGDSTITVRGTARNAKWGAVVVAAAHTPFYVLGLDAWEDGFRDKSVAVSGRLQVSQHLDPEMNEAGEMTQTVQGPQLIIAEAEWKLK